MLIQYEDEELENQIKLKNFTCDESNDFEPLEDPNHLNLTNNSTNNNNSFKDQVNIEGYDNAEIIFENDSEENKNNSSNEEYKKINVIIYNKKNLYKVIELKTKKKIKNFTHHLNKRSNHSKDFNQKEIFLDENNQFEINDQIVHKKILLQSDDIHYKPYKICHDIQLDLISDVVKGNKICHDIQLVFISEVVKRKKKEKKIAAGYNRKKIGDLEKKKPTLFNIVNYQTLGNKRQNDISYNKKNNNC